tara:strand:- start:302 stop:586 length:285 start_codon:yes stop_codon:yes gene_type:complete
MICSVCKKDFKGVANQQVCEDCLKKGRKQQKTEQAQKISKKEIIQITGYKTKHTEEYEVKVKIQDISLGVLVKILLFNLVLGVLFAMMFNSVYG